MLSILVLVISITAALLLSVYYVFPKKDKDTNNNYPETYVIQSTNRMDIQHNSECAAFSSAYVLRHFGVEAAGIDLYKKYPRKLLDGTISPKGIIIFFKKMGYSVKFFCGDLNTLKKHVSRGNPVIAFIRVFPNKRYLHFVPVVGYDKDNLYLADSLEHTINCNEKYYNRKITIREFTEVWKTWVPFHKDTYIVIEETQPLK